MITAKQLSLASIQLQTVAATVGRNLLVESTNKKQFMMESWSGAFTAEVVARPEFQAALALALLTR